MGRCPVYGSNLYVLFPPTIPFPSNFGWVKQLTSVEICSTCHAAFCSILISFLSKIFLFISESQIIGKKPCFMRQIPYIHNEMKIGKIKHCGIISRTQLPDLIGNHWTTLNVCFTRYDQNQMRCCNVRYLPNW